MSRKRIREVREALQPYLAGETARENGDIDCHCPSPRHPGGVDNRRSAVVNFEDGVWYCNAEGEGGSLADLFIEHTDWIDPPRNRINASRRKRAGKPAELPSEALVEGWKSALQSDLVVLEDLKASRGLWTKTADYYELGWDRGAQAYTIPVRGPTGSIVNVRRYQIRPPEGRRKVWGVTGHNDPALYPLGVFNKVKDEIIVCEGELDAIICNQHNFRAVTRTSSARTWRSEWNGYFKGKVVYVCHDMDTAGQSANRKIARQLVQIAKEVRIVRLPYPVTDKHGKDLTDWWLDHDADLQGFRRLLEESQPFDESMGEGPEAIDPSPASVMDAFDSQRTGRPLELTVTVKGKREPGYTVPRKVEYRCTQDMGKKCELCPMKAEDGAMDRLVAGADPAILEMLDTPVSKLGALLRRMIGAPQCIRLNINITAHQAVEVLFARPSVDHANGSGNEDYKSIKLTSVGRHDTTPNQTVRVVGALHPDPKKQLNEFLTWDVSRLETSLDRYEIDGETYNDLKRFQPRPGQRPLSKLREIANDLSQHVTFIYGRPELHAAIDLTFHSAIGFDFDNKRLVRGWLELLVIGDTRTGKSEVASRLVKFYGGGEVVSCESASYAGVVGGLQQFGANKEWAITWGAIPINDRRLVVLDEVSGLTPDDIAAMSSIRSSGLAELTKIQQERTYARTRLVWLGNPRNARMDDFTHGVQAIKPLIGNAEDIARFDFAMCVRSGDVSAADINRSRKAGRQRYSRSACSALLRWVWSRAPEQIIWTPGSAETVYASANELGSRYVEDPPLIQAANVREKVARLSVAVAARLFSADERGETIQVKKVHVLAAVKFLDRLYSMNNFGYSERSAERIAERHKAERNKTPTRAVMSRNNGLEKFFRSQGSFRRQDLEEILDIERDEANAIISELYNLGMIWKDRGDIKLTPTLHKMLRERED